MSRKEEEKARHEYTLMEIRLSAEDVKEYVRGEVKKVEKRVSRLEHLCSYVSGIIGAGILYIKYGHK
jgi:hypothetical protein